MKKLFHLYIVCNFTVIVCAWSTNYITFYAHSSGVTTHRKVVFYRFTSCKTRFTHVSSATFIYKRRMEKLSSHLRGWMGRFGIILVPT